MNRNRQGAYAAKAGYALFERGIRHGLLQDTGNTERSIYGMEIRTAA